jgi:hypothetical protein
LGTFLKGVKEDAAKWIFTNDYLQLFNECIVDPDLTLKQCILSSCGEIAKNCPSILKGCFTQIAPHLYDHLVLTSEQYGPGQMIMACCNNSAWALGELAMAYPDEVAPAVGEFTTKICQLLNGNEKVTMIRFNSYRIAPQDPSSKSLYLLRKTWIGQCSCCCSAS